MAELFEARPGADFALPRADIAEMQHSTGRLLQSDLYRCFGMHNESELAFGLTQLLKGLGGTSLERPFTVSVGDDSRTVLGLEIIKGKSVPPDGTTYERPVGEEDDGYSFVHVPVDGPVTVTAGERELAIQPGRAFLGAEGRQHSVHVPDGQAVLEFVMAAEADAHPAGWGRFMRDYPHPNLGAIR